VAPDFSGLRAHTNADDGRVDMLEKHLARVAELAGKFSSEFGSGDFGIVIGLLHDIGKALPEFQEYLRRLEAGERLKSGPPHAIWGSVLWYVLCGERAWREVCLPIAGHHAGLRAAFDLSLSLDEFAQVRRETVKQLRSLLASSGLLRGVKLPASGAEGLALEFRVRMLLSALGDADFLATEEHFNLAKTAARGRWPRLVDLWTAFPEKRERLLRKPKTSQKSVQEVRAEVYADCLKAAELPIGVFRLTAPTGAGKTLSSLAFALRHALLHPDLRRIVLAVPYTSITEQSAKVYRKVLGKRAVIEHHSNMREPPEDEGQSAAALRARLASENWDAPVIVTTTVQLFESLFARRPGKVRKLHNLARSVILLDEVQTLPLELLRPSLSALRALVEEYGTTVVLCTATQPAFDDTPYLREFDGLPVREIVPECARHFQALERVRYERRPVPVSWCEVAEEVRGHRQALVILNTRRDALRLLDALAGEEGLVHLSTLLCGAHRRKVLDEIGRRLVNGEPVRAICTQVVEAGVDLDFPVVYRALGPLDRIVQAAGRCNREGRMPEHGLVVIFEPAEGRVPAGPYRAGCEQARVMLERDDVKRLHDPALYHEYFQRLFASVDLDKEGIQAYREALDFPAVAERYRFIDDTVPVLVSYEGLNEALVERWRWAPSREAWRGLQPFVVNLYNYESKKYAASGWIEELGPGLCRWLGRYDRLRGISAEALDPADLIVSGGGDGKGNSDQGIW
jgi:CRISPR-associated endonuclease/helicase Cas3